MTSDDLDHNSSPGTPGVYRTTVEVRWEWMRVELWRGWDGRHWSKGCWTRAGCVDWCKPWLEANPPHLMPRDERETKTVVRWRV